MDLRNSYENATRRFGTNLLNKLYPHGGWKFISHPDRHESVAFGHWPRDLYTVCLTVQIEDKGAAAVVTLGLREPAPIRNFYSFTILRYKGPKLNRLPEELCRLDNLDNLSPSDDAIQKAARVIAEA